MKKLKPASPLSKIGSHALARGGSLVAPLSVILELTNACNQNCVFCYQSIRHGRPKTEERHLSLKMIDSLCRQFEKTGVANLTLTGGPQVVLNFLHLSMNLPGGLKALLGSYDQEKKPKSSCHGGEASCAIDIRGNLYLCQFLIDLDACRAGNIFETPLPELWKNLQKAKDRLTEKTADSCAGGCPGFAVEAGLPA